MMTAPGFYVAHHDTRPAALERLAFLQAKGDSDPASVGSFLKEAQAWKTHQCTQLAAE